MQAVSHMTSHMIVTCIIEIKTWPSIIIKIWGYHCSCESHDKSYECHLCDHISHMTL